MTEPQDPTQLGSAPLEPTESHAVDYPPTGSEFAWGLDDGVDAEPVQRFTARRITIAAVAASIAAMTTAAVVGYLHWRTPPASVAKLAAPTPTPSPMSKLSPEDAAFVNEMRNYGVPVNEKDPESLVIWARGGVCGTALDPNEKSHFPPGSHTVTNLTRAVLENNKDWTYQQASRFTVTAIKRYCPDVGGPSRQEIAAMPPEQRFLAILQDQKGLVPVNETFITGARNICRLKGEGLTVGEIVDGINSDMSPDDKRFFAEAAINVLCP